MAVYIFERIDIVTSGRGKFVDMVRKQWARHAEISFGIRLVGVWATVGSTAAWPETNLLWEMDDWEHFAKAQDAQYPLEAKSAYGHELWRQAFRWRSGGESMLLEGASFSPTVEQIKARNLSGNVILQEYVQTKPGGMDAYHQAVQSEYLPLAESRGMRLLGAYRHGVAPNKAMNLWAVDGWPQISEIMESEAQHPGVKQWNQRLTELTDDIYSWLLAPPPEGALRT